MRLCESGIQLDGSLERRDFLQGSTYPILTVELESAHVGVVRARIHLLRWEAHPLVLGQLGPYLVGDGLRDLALQGQHAAQLAVVALGPDVDVVAGVDELHGNSDPLPLPGDGPLGEGASFKGSATFYDPKHSVPAARIGDEDFFDEFLTTFVADANTGWTMHEAARVVRAVRDVDVYIEQPCPTYEECLAVRRRTDHPFVLDENVNDIDTLLKGHRDGAMDVVNLKISKVGGLTRARQIRDLCVALGIPMTIEDSWGGDIVTAAIAHLAHSTPEPFRFSSTDFNSYVSVSNASGAPQRLDGVMVASSEPGLGVVPNMDVLGVPVARYG